MKDSNSYSSPALKDSNSDSCENRLKELALVLKTNVKRLGLGLKSSDVGLYSSLGPMGGSYMTLFIFTYLKAELVFIRWISVEISLVNDQLSVGVDAK